MKKLAIIIPVVLALAACESQVAPSGNTAAPGGGGCSNQDGTGVEKEHQLNDGNNNC